MADPVLEAMDRFGGPLDELGKRQQRLLLAEYRAGWTGISSELEALTAKVASAPRIPIISDGKVIQGIPPSWTFQQDRYVALQSEVRGLIGGMEQTLGTVTKAGQGDGWRVGGDEARAAGRSLAEIPIGSWASVPQGAFQAFVGGATSGPLAPLLQSFAVTNGPEAAVFARNVLGAGLLRGRSAFSIADDLASGLQTLSYSRALRIARTETLRAYREGARQSYMANSQIVQSWVWRAAVENTKRPPCAACFAKHGSIHPVSETMSTHPNCRCRMVPRRSPILGVTPNDPILPDATKAFDALSPAQQRRILGPTRLEMYRSGTVKLPDFATSRARGAWGANDATVRPLSELRSLSHQGRALPTASQRLFEASARGEAEVSAALQRISFETNASLEGFAFRLKKTDRIAEKIATDVADGKGGIVKVTESLNDALRYTYKLTEKRYAAGVDEIMVAMQREGMTIVNTKNFWMAEGGGYRGFHAIMRAKDGTRFEMQFHTAQTLARKEPSHLLYEAQRLITTTPAEKARLQAQIDELWADVRRPRGVERIRQEWGFTAEQFEAKVFGIEDELVLNREFETAVVLERATGRIILDKRGRALDVEFTTAEEASMRGNVLTHNHPRAYAETFPDGTIPGGTSFSDTDVGFFFRNGLEEVRAVSPGWRHSLRPGPGWTGVPEDFARLAEETARAEAAVREIMLEQIGIARRRANEILRALPRSGSGPAAMEAEAIYQAAVTTANFEHNHLLWQHLQRATDLIRYERRPRTR